MGLPTERSIRPMRTLALVLATAFLVGLAACNHGYGTDGNVVWAPDRIAGR